MWMYVIIGVVVALVILLCFALAIASFSFDNYEAKLKETNSHRSGYAITTLEYVNTINKNHFGGKLKIARCREWQDHYSKGVVALSDKTMSSNSLASLSIVSHELGHARQDASGDALDRFWSMRRSGRRCGLFFMPFMILGAVLCLLWVFNVLPAIYYLIAGVACFVIGIVIFVFAIVLKYKEIKIEREASDFAVEYLREILTEDELAICKEFLDSARLTYWAGLIRTLLSWTRLTGKDKMFK